MSRTRNLDFGLVCGTKKKTNFSHSGQKAKILKFGNTYKMEGLVAWNKQLNHSNLLLYCLSIVFQEVFV